MDCTLGLLFLLALGLTCLSRFLQSVSSAVPVTPATQLKDHIVQLKTEAEAFNSPSTFAKYAKMTREITREEQRLQQLQQESRPPTQSYERKLVLSLLRSYAPSAVAVAFIGSHCSLSGDLYEGLWPASAVLGSAQEGRFEVSLMVWYLVCCGVARQAVALIAR